MVKIKNNIVVLIFINMIVFFHVQAMEESLLKDMAPVVKEQIEHILLERNNALEHYRKTSPLCNIDGKRSEFLMIGSQMFDQYMKKITQIALNPSNLMSKQNRLNYLSAKQYFENRKSIIKSMIEDDGINPNEINWQPDTYTVDYTVYNPLLDSISFNDTQFTQYLFAHGARPQRHELNSKGTWSIYQNIQKNDVFIQLFLKHKIMFYFINYQDLVLPMWQDIPLQDLTENLLNLINLFNDKDGKYLARKERRFLIHISHEKQNSLKAIQKAGFIVNYSDSEITQLVYQKVSSLENDNIRT